MHNDWFAFNHALQNLPTTLRTMNAHGYTTLTISVAGTYDRNWESFLAVVLHQEFLTGNFVAGILPMRISQCCSFIDDIVASRLVVSRSGTDIDILTGTTSKETMITLYLLRNEADEFTHSVKLSVTYQTEYFSLIVDIGHNLLHTFRHFVTATATIEKPQFILTLCQLTGNSTADGARSTNY